MIAWRQAPGARISALFLVALSLSMGWGIRGNFGHEAGAMIAGVLAAIAACLLSGRKDWHNRVHYFAFFGGLGWAFGGSIAYMYAISFAGSEHTPSALYGFLILFIEGGLWAAMGGAGTALPAVADRKRLTDFFTPLCFVLVIFALWYFAEQWVDDQVAKLFGADTNWNRHRNPLYWLDADWKVAVLALIAVCLYDLWDRRCAKILFLPIYLGAGAFLGWAAHRLLDLLGATAAVASFFVVPLGDPTAINAATGQPFDPAEFLTNWPNFMIDFPVYNGLIIGLIIGAVAYFARYGAWRRDAGLLLAMAGGWLLAFLIMPVLGSILLRHHGGFRMMPPRSDDWAGIVGVFLGMTIYCGRRGLRPVAFAGSACFILGGMAFAIVPFLRSLLRLPGHSLLTPGGAPPEWAHYQSANWHSILEQSDGFGFGLAIAVTMAVLAVSLKPVENTPRTARWTEIFAVIFVLFGITFLNIVKNVPEWTEGGTKVMPAIMRAPLLGWPLSAETWFLLPWLAATTIVTLLLILHSRRPLEIMPASWIGRGQWLYLTFLTMMGIANFERALPNFAEGRLVTEWVILCNAIIATFLILVLPGRTAAIPPAEERPLSLRRLWAWSAPIALILLVGMALLTRLVYPGVPVESPSSNHKRFGVDALWRTKPILKGGKHS